MLTLTTQQISLLLYLVQDTAANYADTIQRTPHLSSPELDADVLEALADLEAALSMSLAPERAADKHLH